MKKIECEIQELLPELGRFYEPEAWHFLTVNGVDLGEERLELQWIFSKYGAKDEVVIFSVVTGYGSLIPSVVPLIPSATLSEREVVDMFGVKIEGAERGLYLDEDSLEMPLRCSL